MGAWSMTDKPRMFNVTAGDLPRYAFYACSFIFIVGLASIAAHAAWEDRSSDLTGFFWAFFAASAVMGMAACAHMLPETWIDRERAWFGFYLLLMVGAFPWAFYFDFMAISSIFDKAQAQASTQHKTRVNREKTEGELTEELRRLDDQLKVAMTLVDGGASRSVRPLKVIEADGRYLASGKCANIDPKSAGQRTICQEHSFAVDRAKKEAEREKVKGEIVAQRDRLENTVATVSDDVAGAKRFAQVMGWSRSTTTLWLPIILTLFAEFIAVAMPIAAGYTSKKRDLRLRQDATSQTNATPMATGQSLPHNVHVHVSQAPAQAPPASPGQVLVLNEKDEALRRWAEALPSKPN
jgi:hypothetical protein